VLDCCTSPYRAGVDIGHASVIGAGSVVTRSVDAETIVAGNPAKLVGRRAAEITVGVPK
jgi:acetyltransferase-like isoleucine patch superfamily enzyme